ncbi:putative sterigmatocystin biosynthesis monooxygenase stcW [Pseudocercospora fuligena]|uniref:Putative sterigmatocystin biosynthesis monooxygenase stcW n=1 Tax=Pseudocercospora fuligena TaxID=685502 RepID=A0A8H6R631_9PEZI|nr:putative sterigmatocystin biosynthesis monooxygenase stcW [Pseudocercospora fuligena]
MSIPNGVTNGHHNPVANDTTLSDSHQNTPNGTSSIPPSSAHSSSRSAYISKITIPLNDTPAWTPTKKLRIAIIGAGYSGMVMAQKLQHKYQEEMSKLLDFVIYEARDSVGGTWHANTYPGVRCDVPSMIYCFPFETNPEWNNFFSTGGEIQEYFVRAVKKWELEKYVKFEHRVVDARWEEGEAKWRLKVQHGRETFDDGVDILISARGFLSTWRWPQILGIHDFEGKKVHSAEWDHSYDYSNKRIAVVGNGSSGIQILPEMARLPGTTVTSFQRGPTWIVSRHQPAKLMGRDDPNPNPEYLPEEKARLRNPTEMKKYRKNIQGTMNKNFRLFKKGSEYNAEMTEFATKQMAEKLNHDPVLCEKLIPKYELGCRRITPGSGYLEAFTQSNVHLTNSEIASISVDGIHTQDGTFHPIDVLVCATGFDISQVPTFPLIGRDGISLAEKWKDEPESYISLACPDMPNMFFFTGPNATVGHGSLIFSLDWSAEYMLRWIRKMAQEDIASIAPKQEVVNEFCRYSDQIHKTLTWTGGCRSWYKANRVNGRVTATFAGSAILYEKLVNAELRGEDFDIRYRSANRWRFLGNGFTQYELEPGNDLAYYIP